LWCSVLARDVVACSAFYTPTGGPSEASGGVWYSAAA